MLTKLVHAGATWCISGQGGQSVVEEFVELVESFVLKEIGDVRDQAFRLAVGRFKTSPFSSEAMDGLRRQWASLLPRPKSALEVPGGTTVLVGAHVTDA